MRRRGEDETRRGPRVLLGGHRADVRADVRRGLRARFPDHACPGVWPAVVPACRRNQPCLATRAGPWAARSTKPPHPDLGHGRRKNTGHGGERDHLAPKGECGVDGQAAATLVPARRWGGAPFEDGPPQRVPHVRGEWDKDALRYFVDGTLTNGLDAVPRRACRGGRSTSSSTRPCRRSGCPRRLSCGRDLYHYVDYVRVPARDQNSGRQGGRFSCDGRRGRGRCASPRAPIAPRGRGRGFVTRVRARRARRRRSQRQRARFSRGRRRPHGLQSIGAGRGGRRVGAVGGRAEPDAPGRPRPGARRRRTEAENLRLFDKPSPARSPPNDISRFRLVRGAPSPRHPRDGDERSTARASHPA